ncbi:TPA: signal recognition particle-docking protein FtsY [Candidatus Sumerlaeota bacterium]|nr:signal recognition particle-docking protein FtsY [Candidatus Sumerlaeota bacterium]
MSDTPQKKAGFFKRLFGGGSEEQPTETPAETTPTPAETEPSAPVEIAPVAVEPVPVPQPVVEPAPQPEEPETKEGFFARLKKQLSKTKTSLVEKVRNVIRLHGKVNEELLEEIEMILVQADVGIETTTKIIDEMRKNSEARKVEGPDALIALFKESLLNIVTHDEHVLKLQSTPPTIVLFVGVNGTGKTTTIGKLAKEFKEQGKRVLLVAADTFRAAAVEQLTLWSERIGVEISKKEMGSDPASVCFEALSGHASQYDVILIDTAGRLHTRSNLMEELKKIDRVIKKVLPEAPHETILVLDATTGQNALNQAKIFSEAVNVTGFIMTKLDGTAKGGVLIALRNLFDIPILKIGIGESEHDLRDFDPTAFVDALFEVE